MFDGVQVVPIAGLAGISTVQLAYRTHPRPGLLVSVRRSRRVAKGPGTDEAIRTWEAVARVAVWMGLRGLADVPPGLRIELRVDNDNPTIAALAPLSLAVRLAAQSTAYPRNALVVGMAVPGGRVWPLPDVKLPSPLPPRVVEVRGDSIRQLMTTLGGRPADESRDDESDGRIELPPDLHAVDAAATELALRQVLAQYAVGRAMDPPLAADWDERVRRVSAHLRTIRPTTVDEALTSMVAAAEIVDSIASAQFATLRFKSMLEAELRSAKPLEGWRMQWVKLLTETIADAAPRVDRWATVLKTDADPGVTGISAAWLAADARSKRELHVALRRLIDLVAPPSQQRPRPFPHSELRLIIDPAKVVGAAALPDSAYGDFAEWSAVTMATARLASDLAVATLARPRALVNRIETGRQYELTDDREFLDRWLEGLCHPLASVTTTEVARLARCGEEPSDRLSRLLARLTAVVLKDEAHRLSRVLK